MPLKPLRILLEQAYSSDNCLGILNETAALYKEPLPFRWYFLLLNRIFGSLIDNPSTQEADQVEPILEFIYRHARFGLDGAEAGDVKAVMAAANQLTEAYSAIP